MNKSGLTAQSDQLSIIPVRVSVGIMVRVQLVSCPCIYFLQVLSVLLMVMLQVAARNAAPDPPLHPSTPVHHPPSAHKRVERQGTNSPLFFDQPSYTASVVENSPVGTEVVTVQPHTNDEPLSGELTYSLQQGGSARYFSVDSSTGVVTTSVTYLPTPPLKALLLPWFCMGCLESCNKCLWGCREATFVTVHEVWWAS